jgi:DNA polymerase alpha subunit A
MFTATSLCVTGIGSGLTRTTEQILALAEHNRVRFGTLKAVVDRYLDKCGRQWVAMDSLFGKLGYTI